MARITDIGNEIGMKDIDKLKKYLETDIRFEHTYGKILGALRDNILEIEFVKKSGELREMVCTRNNKYILDNYDDTTYEGDVENLSKRNTQALQTRQDIGSRIIKVYDIDKKDFRSVLVDSIKRIDYIRKL